MKIIKPIVEGSCNGGVNRNKPIKPKPILERNMDKSKSLNEELEHSVKVIKNLKEKLRCVRKYCDRVHPLNEPMADRLYYNLTHEDIV